MLRYALHRLFTLVLSLAAASVVIFCALEIVPGDPAVTMLGINASEETLVALRAELGIGGNPVVRYLAWVTGLVQGDFGISYTYRTPVAELIGDRIWVSFPLALYALGLSIAVGVPLGVLAAQYRGRAVDMGLMGVAGFGISMPNFWFGMLLVLLFSVHLGWFSAGGFPGWEAGVFAALNECGSGAAPPRAAQCDDPGADDHRAAVLVSAGWRGDHREGVLLARPWPADLPSD